MSVRSITIVLLALIFGGSLAFGINNFVRKGQVAAASPPVETVAVVIAKADIGRFADLTEDMLYLEQRPKEWAPPDCLHSIEEVIGRVTLSSVRIGESLSTARITERGAGRGIGTVIPRGMRAFTIQMPNVASSVAGFVLPGSKVDVLLTAKHQGADDGAGGGNDTTPLHNIEVLAVDQRVESPGTSKVDPKEVRSITLLVTPDQADKLAKNSGTLQLSLRNPDDTADLKKPQPVLVQEKAIETVSVVIAADNIPINTNITEGMVKIQQFPKQLVPPGSIHSLAEAVGRVSNASVVKGEHISSARLTSKGETSVFGLDIPLGKRAFTIQMPNVASSVAGFTRAGSKVDVLLSVKNKGAIDAPRVTTTLLEDIKVLAVDQRVESSDGKIDPKEVRSITLLVTPEQADTLAQYTGDLQLSLRNPEDSTLKGRSTQTPASLSVTRPAALIQTIRGVHSNYLELR